MEKCTQLSREMLPNPINVDTGGRSIDFGAARKVADQKVGESTGEAMLLAWLDSTNGRFSPDVICCGYEKPAWLVYAESRGADISVDVNGGQFVFVYASHPGYEV